MKNKILVAVFLLYLTAPFFSGVFNYWNPRGPKIYNGEYHFWMHGMGAGVAGRLRPYDVMFERPWFYGGAKIRSKLFKERILKKDESEKIGSQE